MSSPTPTRSSAVAAGSSAVVLGLGIAGRAVTRALMQRDIAVTAVDDRPSTETHEFAETIGCTLITNANRDTFDRLFADAALFVPSPGIPEHHVAFAAAAHSSVRKVSEFDVARWYDDRPIAAITGTDGKTSVTMLTVAMLEASGVSAAAVGNTEVPLVDVINSPEYDVFVVEASSFRLGHTERFTPTAAAWLNFSPDHLDVHESLAHYEAAKARIWADLEPGTLAVAPANDALVRSHVPTTAGIDVVLVGKDAGAGANAYVHDGQLRIDDVEVCPLDALPRTFDHDITNTLVAAALAQRLGATPAGIEHGVRTHELAPHRIQHVADIDGVAYYNDSKATVPHAVVTAISGFDSVVLVAGGKNKGLDLSEMADAAERVRAVVALGDAADEVAGAFDGIRPVHRATNMDHAVTTAAELAERGDVVLLSPGCASFDHYENYGARGDDFIRAVQELEVSQ